MALPTIVLLEMSGEAEFETTIPPPDPPYVLLQTILLLTMVALPTHWIPAPPVAVFVMIVLLAMREADSQRIPPPPVAAVFPVMVLFVIDTGTGKRFRRRREAGASVANDETVNCSSGQSGGGSNDTARGIAVENRGVGSPIALSQLAFVASEPTVQFNAFSECDVRDIRTRGSHPQ